MSLRYFSLRFYKNGRHLFRLIYQRQFSGNIRDATADIASRSGSYPRSIGIRSVGTRARSVFADTILSKVTPNINPDLRRRATKRLLYGDIVPFFSLVGVSLAAGTGMLTKEDELESLCLEIRDAISKFKWHTLSFDINESVFASEDITIDRLTIGLPLSKGCSAVVYAAKLKEETDETLKIDSDSLKDITSFPLALKLMFNYDINSCAMSILRAMYRETVPAMRYYSNEEASAWESQFTERRVSLPPHPNIVTMYSVFVDTVPKLSGAMSLYPAALPQRLNPSGYGRNMSLFLLMKRYQYSLADYLKLHQLTPRNSILLFTQLLEAVTHINLYGIAHRDLKSDNILVDAIFSEEDTVPVLVVSDFGCCLADYVNGLNVPYNSQQVDKGGNACLMAPEITNQTPGPFSVLNYTKSDVWAAGAIAYEIFGSRNPFYHILDDGSPLLRSATYEDKDLPDLGDNIPILIRQLVRAVLAKNPNKRLSAEVSANVCQLYLWAPSHWIKSTTMPSSSEIIQWLLCLTTKVLYEGRLPDSFNTSDGARPSRMQQAAEYMTTKSTRRTHPEYVLLSSFLGRARLHHIKQALSWIQNS